MVKGVDPLRPALARVGWGAMFTNSVGGAVLHSSLCSLYGLPAKKNKVCIVMFEARGVARCLSFCQNSVTLTPRGREKLAALLSPRVLVVGCLVVPFWRLSTSLTRGGEPLLECLVCASYASSALV